MPGIAGHHKAEASHLNYRAVDNNTKRWWFLDPGLSLNMMHCVGLCGTLFFNGYDGSLMNGLQSIDKWQEYFHHPSPTTLGLMNSAGFLPGVVASFFGDRLAKFVGKRWALWTSIIITCAGIILMSLSKNTGEFIAGRAVLGFGSSAALAVAPAQLHEIAHPRYRAPVSGFFTSIYYIAAIMSAVVCLACLNMDSENAWRIPSWVQLVGPLLTLLLTCTMPESPRHLVKQGKVEEAHRIIARYHANGKMDDGLVLVELKEIQEAIGEESEQPQTKYTDFLRSPGNRHRLMILFVVGISLNWVGNGIISYYLSPILNGLGIKSKTTQLEILIGLHVWNLILSTFAAVYIDKIGRRPLWLMSTTGLITTMAAIMGLSAGYATYGIKACGTAVIPFLFLFYGSYDLAYTPMSYSYPIEILTYSMRTKGSAIYITVVALAVAMNTWVNPIALDALHWKYYGVFLAIDSVLFAIQYFGFPETRNLTIEEIAVVFDGNNAVARAMSTVGEDVISIHEHSSDNELKK